MLRNRCWKQERRRLEDDAQAMLRGMIGKDTSRFAQQRSEAIWKDANQFYQEFHPGDSIDAGTVSKIISGLEERLKDSLDGDFLPKVSFATISLESRDASSHVQLGARQNSLDCNRTIPREVITDSYFFRGYRVPLADVLAAMNVAEDCLATNWPVSAARVVAESQLAAIEKIGADSAGKTAAVSL